MEGISVEQAVEQILQHTPVINETEETELNKAGGRILAQDMVAGFDNPPFDRSPVDGYACKAEDLAGATKEHPVRLKVMEEIDAGQYSEREIQQGQAVRIMTGAAIPNGCNCCIYQEDTDYGEDTVEVYSEQKRWSNYCFAGEDFKKGTTLLKKGTHIGYVEAAILAGMGVAKVPVYRQPRIVLLTTGDEVVEPGIPLPEGKIYNSNMTMLSARLRELGIESFHMEAVKDDPTVMSEKLKEAAKAAEEAAAAKARAVTVQNQAVAASYDDVTILAALIQCEAGNECYDGQVAVGAVVCNRVRSGGYPGSVYGVVYQSGQFTPAARGSVASVAASGPNASCIQAAQAALAGTDNTGGALSFRPTSSGRGGVVIGNHVFF